MTILYVDTESDIITKEIISIQLKWGKYTEIIKNFNHLERLYALWENSEAVIMYNAPYDMGVLSSLKGEGFGFEYVNNAWNLLICGCKYTVKRIGGFRNRIKPYKNAPPVIDLLKLWSILVSDRDISLKSLIRKELKENPIPFSEENAKTRAYQLQDVIQLEKLWSVFLKKIENIPTVQHYTFKQWVTICTPATFSKIAYKDRYPELKQWQDHNNKQNKLFNLDNALTQAYNGGITCALYHGTVNNTAWFDIHGAYAHVIEYLNTDQYKIYNWSRVRTMPKKTPALCKVSTNTFITSINSSLKIFQTKEKREWFMWNFDIFGLELLFNNADIEILEIYKPIGLNDVPRALSAEWAELKEKEEKAHGKTTLREYYKFLSNTSYGITAQRNPYKTIHTNMCIAGIITSRAHLILCEMIHTARQKGCDWLYSDTDSICVRLNGVNPAELEEELNKVIAPYSCGCEFIGTTKILSLKRYIAYNGKDLDDNLIPSKVRLHGKSIYYIDEIDMSSMLSGQKNYSPLLISQIGANTERTFNRCLKLNTTITNPHPFMFETRIDTGKCKQDFFDQWIQHIDTKLTVPKGARIDDEFKRDFFIFQSLRHAEYYYAGKMSEDVDICGLSYRLWDVEDKMMFGDD